MSTRRSLLALVSTMSALALVVTPGALSALTSSVAGTDLTVTSDAGDSITITCSGGDVQVNGLDPDTGPAACSSIDYVEVVGGSGANVIDLTGLTAVDFPALTAVDAFGGVGDDDIDASGIGSFVNASGQDGNDTLTGGNAGDILIGDEPGGAAGDDTLIGGPGNDNLSGYIGADTMDGGEGGDIYGVNFHPTTATTIADTGSAPPPCGSPPCYSMFDDILDAHGTTAGDNIVLTNTQIVLGTWVIAHTGLEQLNASGQDGNDIVDASAVTAVRVSLVGNGGDDTLTGGSQFDQLNGDQYPNEFCGGPCPPPPPTGDDTLLGGAGADNLWALGGTDSLDGQEGDDYYQVVLGDPGSITVNDTGTGPGNDSSVVRGTPGDDTIVVTDTTATNGAASVSVAGVEFRNVNGDLGNDTLDGSAATMRVSLNGEGGNDTLIGGSGNDSLQGDQFYFGCAFCPPPPPPGNDTLTGNGGSDYLAGRGGNDSYDGGQGSDTVQFELAIAGVSTATDSGPAQLACPPCGEFDNLNASGSPASDLIFGTGSAYSTAAATINYDATMESAWANGGPGDDVMDASDAIGAVSFAGNEGGDTLIGGPGNDYLRGDDFYSACGGCPPTPPPGNDNVQGGAGDDYTFVRGGTDSVDGGDGSDYTEIRFGVPSTITVGDSGPGTDDDEVGFFGTAGNDTITLTPGQAAMGGEVGTHSGVEEVRAYGDTGDDTLNASAMTALASLDGGPGNDVLTGGSGSDYLTGGPGNDVLNAGLGTDSLWGSDGDDLMDGGLGGDYFDGGTGTDTASYATRTLSVKVTLGQGIPNDGQTGEGDRVETAMENVIGGSGADNLTGDGNPNVLTGGSGNDNLDGGLGPDILIGGIGADSAIYTTRTASVTVSIGGGPDGEGGGLEGDDVQGDIERIQGGSGDDTLTGSDAANFLYGNVGNDSISGGLGNDVILGGAGNDTMLGGDASDSLDGGAGNDVFSGGTGTDTATYAARSVSVNVTVGAGANDGASGEADDVQADMEYVQGGSAADTLTGGAGAEYLYGNAGADVLAGGGGNDWLFGGAGVDALSGGNDSDYLDGGTQADTMHGDAGTDVAYYQSRTAAQPVDVTLDGLANDGESGENDLVGPTTERVYGGAGADSITGNALANALYGNGGNDTLDGGAGNDTLYGLAGSDVLTGGDGLDILDGGFDTDTMSGGTGADTVYYTTRTAAQPVTVILGGGSGNGQAGENDTISADIERAAGGKGNDVLSGDANANILSGGDGNDTITGGGGIDTISGQNGNDTMQSQGDAAADVVSCGTGTDGGTADIADTVNADCETVLRS